MDEVYQELGIAPPPPELVEEIAEMEPVERAARPEEQHSEDDMFKFWREE